MSYETSDPAEFQRQRELTLTKRARQQRSDGQMRRERLDIEFESKHDTHFSNAGMQSNENAEPPADSVFEVPAPPPVAECRKVHVQDETQIETSRGCMSWILIALIIVVLLVVTASCLQKKY